MRVTRGSFTETMYQNYQKNQAGKAQENDYNNLLQAAAKGMKTANEPEIQIWVDYKDWKAQQPPRKLPESKGVTEENIAYLKANFSGELSLFQRIEAVDTMREMGMLSREQMMNGLGLGGSLVLAGNTKIISYGTPEVARNFGDWTSFFAHSPIMKMDDLDALFEVLDQQLHFNGQGTVADNIQAVLDKVTHKVH